MHTLVLQTCPWMSPHTVTGVETGWTLDSSNNNSQTTSHSFYIVKKNVNSKQWKLINAQGVFNTHLWKYRWRKIVPLGHFQVDIRILLRCQSTDQRPPFFPSFINSLDWTFERRNLGTNSSMAATMRRCVKREILKFGTISLYDSIVHNLIRKNVPCCTYASFAGKAAAGMMQQNPGQTKSKFSSVNLE